ncbi:hypothetical protein KAZ66_04345, partial [Candidatus Woesebacteria bacterium]|nr:hypothetical protein [Candidatus Woesebacteria bacterium]
VGVIVFGIGSLYVLYVRLFCHPVFDWITVVMAVVVTAVPSLVTAVFMVILSWSLHHFGFLMDHLNYF